ncbi:hypothetical protein DL764_001477 [Monosporascus ibericus]|uniref:Uncharacterized protein n=1 Tax=Monosporascus ibericus TaxID=155417 RepID=A0A4Q4TU42_9PEZI|nr:hypothetical protein DL764_001477 [Monosporascus ibericus]
MAPIRRYLRITKYSVLECRIYLDDPALAQTWLLNPRKPVLPRVIESVRPLVLPKLREERERSRKRSTKKKAIKDVVVEDDFEVSIFLTETNTRHSLLTKHKHFHDTTQTKLTSNNAGRLVGAASEAPIDVDDPAVIAGLLRREESDEDVGAALAAIPAAVIGVDADETMAGCSSGGDHGADGRRPAKRPRRYTTEEAGGAAGRGQESDVEPILSDDDDEDDGEDALFVDRSPNDGNYSGLPPAKRHKGRAAAAAANPDGGGGGDDKKKLAMDISYEGFSIYGRVLCLVVKRRDGGNTKETGSSSGQAAGGAGGGRGGSKSTKAGGGGQAMMENFIISTQVPAGADAT